MTTPERKSGRAELELHRAEGEPGEGRGLARRVGRAGLRALVVATCLAGLGAAAGPQATPAGEAEAEPTAGWEVGRGCAIELPPGHPPIETMQGLPPGHPPIGAYPRLPAGHPPIPSIPPVLRSPPVSGFTI
jgi:hypothetical protein